MIASARWLRLVALVIVAAGCERARPPAKHDAAVILIDAPKFEPTDIVLAIDLSKSMEDTDIAPDRVEATKRAVRRFVAASTHDRIGLVVYGQKPLLAVPLTADAKTLDDRLARLRIGDVPELGTALGDAIAVALDELRDSTAKHKAVVLLGDGDGNWVIKVDPPHAIEIAKTLGIAVFTVMVGKSDGDLFGGASSDAKSLEHIATATGATFYRGEDNAMLDRNLQALRDKLDGLARNR